MIEGAITTSAIMALIAAFITQGVKQAIPEQYHRFIPLPLGALCVGIGIGQYRKRQARQCNGFDRCVERCVGEGNQVRMIPE